VTVAPHVASSITSPADSPDLAGARAALDRGDWRAAVDLTESLLAHEESGDAHLLMATALWCGYEIDRSIAEMKAAYRHFIRESRPHRAGFLAAWIACEELTTRGNPAVARGWMQRAKRMVEDAPACAERGWLLLWDAAMMEFSEERFAAAIAEALQIARGCGDRDLELEAQTCQGLLLVQSGRVDEGMAILDEVMAAVTGGETSMPLVVGDAFCLTLGACEQVGDFSRAEQWCRVGLKQTDSRANGFLRASCLATYGWLLTALGDWREGESRLAEATALFKTGHRQLQPHAAVNLAELRRRQGRVAEARRMLADSPRSAAALRVLVHIALDEGDNAAALTLAREMEATVNGFPVTEHVVALQLVVLAAAALGDVEVASVALTDLERAAATIQTDAACGSVSVARAALLEARGDHQESADEYAQAARRFTSARAPFEAANAWRAQGAVLRAAGDGRAADRAEASAREQLRRLGQVTPDDPLSRREREVLTLLARGSSNAAIADALELSPHTVHRHVANVLRKLDAPTRAAAVAKAGRVGLI
jgi:ATP/maltotriose-dependent transcriptional regulator MalT